jgi:hypothetical protein
MSDQPNQPFFGGFLPLPPGMKEQMEEIHARHEMESQSIRHQILNLFNELERDHLFTLRIILSSLASAPGKQSSLMASYYEGIASAKLDSRFDVCPGCGENHDERMMDELKFAQGDGVKKTEVETVEGVGEPFDGTTEGLNLQMTALQYGTTVHEQLELFPDARSVPETLSDGDQELMDEYNLDDLREEGTHKLLGFVCLGCGKNYQSIQDRMLRQPGIEGCDGCINKQKWG